MPPRQSFTETMARHAQPREVAELKGADKKNPQRYRGEVAKTELPLGNAPEYMSEDAKAVWFELETYALPGVLTGSDRLLMEVVSTLVAEFRRDPDGFQSSKHSVLKGHMATLGLSPSARQQFVKPEGSKGNPFDAF